MLGKPPDDFSSSLLLRILLAASGPATRRDASGGTGKTHDQPTANRPTADRNRTGPGQQGHAINGRRGQLGHSVNWVTRSTGSLGQQGRSLHREPCSMIDRVQQVPGQSLTTAPADGVASPQSIAVLADRCPAPFPDCKPRAKPFHRGPHPTHRRLTSNAPPFRPSRSPVPSPPLPQFETPPANCPCETLPPIVALLYKVSTGDSLAVSLARLPLALVLPVARLGVF